MPELNHINDNKRSPTSHEVHVDLEVGQGKENLKLRGLGGSKDDAIQNAVLALRNFLTRAKIERKTAKTFLTDFKV